MILCGTLKLFLDTYFMIEFAYRQTAIPESHGENTSTG